MEAASPASRLNCSHNFNLQLPNAQDCSGRQLGHLACIRPRYVHDHEVPFGHSPVIGPGDQLGSASRGVLLGSLHAATDFRAR